jgi:uroporphyrinogen decarboxylase
MNRLCNDRCEKAIGIRPFSEAVTGPAPLRIEEVMGSRKELIEGGTPWLEPGASTIAEMHALLDQVEALTDDQFRDRVFSTGATVTSNPETKTVVAGSRAPATMATSILGTMNVLYWIVDYPEDMDRFFRILGDTIIRYHRLFESETNTHIEGYSWLDDNCCLYSPLLYERFCYPAMMRVFEAFAPLPEHYRFQHSDSDMAHLLPYLAKMNLHGVNLGPNICVQDIRSCLPHTYIYGQVAPMTLRNKSLDEVVAEVRRDYGAVGRDGGLQITTAGSVSAGTSLESLRGLMWAVQTYCRYDRPNE